MSQLLLRSLASSRTKRRWATTFVERILIARFQPILLIIRSIIRAHKQNSCLFRATLEHSKTEDCSIVFERVPYFAYHFNNDVVANRSSLLTPSFGLSPNRGTVTFAFSAARRRLIVRDFFLDLWSSSLLVPLDSSLLDSSSSLSFSLDSAVCRFEFSEISPSFSWASPYRPTRLLTERGNQAPLFLYLRHLVCFLL